MYTNNQSSVDAIGTTSGSQGSGGSTAKRVLSSLLETSGLVCGSLKDTVQDKLADIDMEKVESEIDNIKTRLGPTMERPRERILNLAGKACGGGKNDEAISSTVPIPMGGMNVINGSFLDDTTLDGIATEGGRTLSTVDCDDETNASTLMTAETPPKHKSRFAAVVDEAKKHEKAVADAAAAQLAAGGGNVVIGLCLSRKNSTLGHPDTVTRQTAFDFNELQDRDYKYVSSTDESGWLAGGGERGDPYLSGVPKEFDHSGSMVSEDSSDGHNRNAKSFGAGHKIAAPDRVHIPIIQINAASSTVIDEIVSALARGEIFIPEVSVLPETLSVNSTSPPDLVVRFGCEKNDDTNPEEWSNWCLEFLHNQLYDYFANVGAQWSRRPFQITLARKVRWMTVKHMNKYFARSEQVINSWREKGPQYLQPPYSDDSSRGVILEEITRPHGIYLIQNGAPTNYFAPNMPPPYTTKMRRSLIRNVINKSWDAKHRDWLSEPIPRMRGPVQMISSVMGCTNPGHLSPVEEKAVSSNVGVFHMRSDFDLVADGRETSGVPQMPEGGSSRKSDRKNKEGHRGEKKKQQQQKRESKQHHHSRKDERQKELDMKPTVSIPSDESYGNSTRPSGTMSLSLEETDSAIDPITAARTASNSVESPGRGKQWSGELSPDRSSQDHSEGEKKSFFNAVPHGRTSSFGSSKGVSFSDSSLLTESERERKMDRRQRSLEKLKVDASLPKMDDRRAEKFARTKKNKRREMRDRRQDENGERSTSTPSSQSTTRRSHNTSPKNTPLSPSCESMAYSLDSSSQFRPPAINTNFNDGAGSVMTSATENQSLLSYVTRSTMVQSRFTGDDGSNMHAQAAAPEEEGEDDISLSLLESKSSMIPSDEELNAIGWAKALDANSGSYYYFTLDRSKTVWENPLR